MDWILKGVLKMKKRLLVLFVAVLAVLMVSACGNMEKSVFSVEAHEDDNTINVTAENGSAESEGNGYIKVGADEEIVIDYDVEGEISVKFYNTDDSDHKEPLAEFTCTGADQGVASFGEGEFDAFIKVVKDATGTIKISTRKIGEEEGAEKWNQAKDAAEAAKAAGLDGFDFCEGSSISLGEVKAEKIEYMEGVVHAYIPIAAVDMNIYKGLSSIDEGDISFDQNKYKHEWTQNVKGLEVKCFGNREGEATKTIWTSGDYSYAVTAYGAGGDDDYGLSADDLSSLINGIQ